MAVMGLISRIRGRKTALTNQADKRCEVANPRGVVNFTSLPTAVALTNNSLGREIWSSILAPQNLLTVKPTSVIIGVSEKSLPPLNNVVVGKGKTMKSSKTAPQWAIDLVTQVCSDYNRALPVKFQWYNRTRKESCGHVSYHQRKLHVAAGQDDWQHKPVLLHELSHWLMAKTSKGQAAGHNKKFWQLYWQLNERYGSLELAYERDVKLAREWRPNTRAWAVNTYPGSI